MDAKKLVWSTLLVVFCSGAIAAEPNSTTRDERMDAALQDYRSSQTNDRPGPMARAENSIKHGFHKAGAGMKHGAHEVGHAVSEGAHKTGQALHRAGCAPSEVDLLLYADSWHQGPDGWNPHHYLQRHLLGDEPGRSLGFQLGSNVVSAGFSAAAALLGAWMVHTLGRMQQARTSAPPSYHPL